MANSFSLFDEHLIDLRRISPDADDVFVCPLCFHVIHRKDVNPETVNLGHIWPSFLRNIVESDKAKHQQVLLCKSCNSSAGNRGDKEMQEHEKAKQGLLPSKVWVNAPGEAPLELCLFVAMSDDGPPSKIDIKIEVPQGEWHHSERWKKFRELANSEKQIDIAVSQFTTDRKLAYAGWLTSAYLFAFYTFGYRYVFHDILDPVRDYIQQSFHSAIDATLDFDRTKDMMVQTCKMHNHQEPKIIYQIKIVDSFVPHHLEISLLDYHVRLPIPLKECEEAIIISSHDPKMTVFADATGHMPHDEECIWEQLLDEPNYEVIGSGLRKK